MAILILKSHITQICYLYSLKCDRFTVCGAGGFHLPGAYYVIYISHLTRRCKTDAFETESFGKLTTNQNFIRKSQNIPQNPNGIKMKLRNRAMRIRICTLRMIVVKTFLETPDLCFRYTKFSVCSY